jgi:hypothetical protein
VIQRRLRQSERWAARVERDSERYTAGAREVTIDVLLEVQYQWLTAREAEYQAIAGYCRMLAALSR